MALEELFAEQSDRQEVDRPSLTPELVLVSPDLAPLARALLPDRPWETMWSREASRTILVRVDAPRPLPAGPETPAPAPKHGWLGMKALVVAHGFAFAAFVALVVVASALPPRDAPTLAPGSSRNYEVQTAATTPTTEGRSTSSQQAKPARRTSIDPTAVVSRSTVGQKAMRARLAQRPAMRFRINRGGRLIARFDGVLRCAGRVTLVNLAVSSEGAFRVNRQFWLARRSVIVSLSGSMDPKRAVQGTVRAWRKGCDTGPVAFAAQAVPG